MNFKNYVAEAIVEEPDNFLADVLDVSLDTVYKTGLNALHFGFESGGYPGSENWSREQAREVLQALESWQKSCDSTAPTGSQVWFEQVITRLNDNSKK
jgi:hypothetical protein